MTSSAGLAGREIGRYRIVSLLGSGGMGEVYDAVDTTLGRHVALKVLPRDAVGDRMRVSRFVQEARAAATVTHPHLVPIYEIGEDAGVLFIAMEKVDGRTLREALGTTHFPTKDSINLMTQVTEAVAAAHAAGVVHRDLKPENIMLSDNGYAKVLDFGLAKLDSANLLSTEGTASTALKATATGTVMGTVGYMSPEQAQGKVVDHRSDIFSLGCILYEMLEGRRAFAADTAVDALHKIIHAPVPPLRAETSSEIERIVRKATAKNPDERYQSARDLAIDLRNARTEIESRSPAIRPHLLVAVVIAVVVLGALTAVVTTVMRRRSVPASATPQLQVQRITNDGDVINAAISPDGNYIAYARFGEKGQSGWIRQLTSKQDLQLIAPASDNTFSIWGVTFSPDGNRVLFVIKKKDYPEGLLVTVPILGGRAEELMRGADCSVAFSPDGKRITYVRSEFPQHGMSALMVANSDGTGAHPIAVRHAPQFFSPIWFTAPSWSPDGKLIATASLTRGDKPHATIVGIDPDRGTETLIADHGWQHVGKVSWLPDGKSLVAIAGNTMFVDKLSGAQDNPIWIVPYGGGTPHPITRDVDAYRNPTLSADGRSLVCIRLTEPIIELWRVPMSGAQPEKLMTGLRPIPHPTYLPDGRIAFTKSGVISTVGAAGEGGEHVVDVVRDRYHNETPTRSGNALLYTAIGPDGETICRTSFSGEGRTTVARGRLMGATRDGSTIAYARDGALWLRSSAKGIESRVFAPFDSEVDIAAISPDGERIAIDHAYPHRRVDVMMTRSRNIIWSTPLSSDWAAFHWTPDGTALLMSGVTQDRANIYKTDFRNPPVKVTNFYGEFALDCDISPDGKNLAVVRSLFERDAVLIRGFQ